MKNKANVSTILSLLILLVELVFAVSLHYVFHACVSDGDSYMACHWAQQAVVTLAVVASIQSIFALISKKAVRAAIFVAELPVIIACAIIPGNIINLCMMATMRCQFLMRPVVIAFSVVICLLILADVFFLKKEK